MNGSDENGAVDRPHFLVGAAVVIAVVLWAGAASLAWKAAAAEDLASNLLKARYWPSAMFAFALGVGLIGSAAALCTKSESDRSMWTGVVLLGFAGLSMSLIMVWYANRSAGAQPVTLLPFVLPAALVFAGLMKLVAAVRFADDPGSPDEINQQQQ